MPRCLFSTFCSLRSTVLQNSRQGQSIKLRAGQLVNWSASDHSAKTRKRTHPCLPLRRRGLTSIAARPSVPLPLGGRPSGCCPPSVSRTRRAGALPAPSLALCRSGGLRFSEICFLKLVYKTLTLPQNLLFAGV